MDLLVTRGQLVYPSYLAGISDPDMAAPRFLSTISCHTIDDTVTNDRVMGHSSTSHMYSLVYFELEHFFGSTIARGHGIKV